MAKIRALVEQRLALLPGQGITETIAKIELCRVATALAEIAIGRPGDTRLGLGYRFDDDAAFLDKQFEMGPRPCVSTSINNDTRFEIACGRQKADGSFSDNFGNRRGFGFVVENGNKGRSIDNHFGNPNSS